MPALQFGLGKAKQSGASKPTPAKQKPIFGGDDDSDADDAPAKSQPKTAQALEITTFDLDDAPAPAADAPTKPSSKQKKPPHLPASATTPTLSSTLATRAVAASAEDVDPTIYDYDAHYATTSTAAALAARQRAQRADAETRTPKYMNNMRAAAEQRRRDELRARDKVLQREREAEAAAGMDGGDAFVTGAYKAQQAEARRVEAEEAVREEREERQRKETGMAAFHRAMMDEREEAHAAVEKGVEGVEGAVEEMEEEARREVEAARRLNEQGGGVVINEEGLVADKRQLLQAGLNVAAKPKAPTGGAGRGQKAGEAPRASQPERVRGNRDAQQAMRERQSRMVEAQLEAAQKRAAEEEAEELQKREAAAKSRKTAADVSSAKERYLQRKREAAAAAAAEGGKG